MNPTAKPFIPSNPETQDDREEKILDENLKTIEKHLTLLIKCDESIEWTLKSTKNIWEEPPFKKEKFVPRLSSIKEEPTFMTYSDIVKKTEKKI